MTPQRWSSLMQGLGTGSHVDTYERLVAAYGESHRHYHTGDHIAACLVELDDARDLATFPAEVEVALWFHDAIYKTTASDNEARSAAWAAGFLVSAEVAPPVRERVHDHIMATRHDVRPAAGDSALVVDIDLSILGEDPASYRDFERKLREEYQWVPMPLYRRKRREILQSFLDRESIYTTPPFRDRYEAQARMNVREAVDQLTT
jgi:predicted metal-dependent HD superfamily phosphohydrolase